MSDEEKAEAQRQSLISRLEKAEARLKKAEEEGNENIDAFRQGVEKLKQKLSELPPAQVTNSTSDEPEKPELSAAEAAIEKAKAKAAAQANMSDEEKAEAQKQSLISRLEKAEARLKKAEDEGNENIDAFRTGVDKLKQKLEQLEEQT